MSPWHEPLPEEWSAVESAIEVQLAPPPTIVAPIAASAEGRTRRQTKDALRVANAAAARDWSRRYAAGPFVCERRLALSFHGCLHRPVAKGL